MVTGLCLSCTHRADPALIDHQEGDGWEWGRKGQPRPQGDPSRVSLSFLGLQLRPQNNHSTMGEAGRDPQDQPAQPCPCPDPSEPFSGTWQRDITQEPAQPFQGLLHAPKDAATPSKARILCKEGNKERVKRDRAGEEKPKK